MKDTKIKCNCGCSSTLYIAELDFEIVTIGSEPNAKKGFKYFKGVMVDRNQLIDLLKEK